MSYGQQIYGSILYYENIFPSDQVIDVEDLNLMKYLPTYYLRSGVMTNLQQSLAKEIVRRNYSNQDIFNQLFIDTATWGLELWERELAIPTDISKTYEDRRSFIKAKVRGIGTTTKSMIQNTSSSYSNTEVEVIENFNDYSFKIKFVGTRGIPPNMASLIQTIEEIKPAHLNYTFEYTYTWWNTLNASTWNTLSTKTWNEVKTI